MDIREVGASPDLADNTDLIQKAIDSADHDEIVCIPDGIFKVDAEKGLHLKTGTRMAIVGTLQAIPNSNTHSSIITMNDVNDVQIYLSGQVIGERAAHIGQTGEWGMGISILKSSDIVVGGPGSISNCWGDGFYVWEGKNIYIKGITLNSNRRNNMSVISVDGLSVESCIFSDAHGTAPQAGIDMEPDFPVEFIKNVNIFNNKFTTTKDVLFYLGLAMFREQIFKT